MSGRALTCLFVAMLLFVVLVSPLITTPIAVPPAKTRVSLIGILLLLTFFAIALRVSINVRPTFQTGAAPVLAVCSISLADLICVRLC